MCIFDYFTVHSQPKIVIFKICFTAIQELPIYYSNYLCLFLIIITMLCLKTSQMCKQNTIEQYYFIKQKCTTLKQQIDDWRTKGSNFVFLNSSGEYLHFHYLLYG